MCLYISEINAQQQSAFEKKFCYKLKLGKAKFQTHNQTSGRTFAVARRKNLVRRKKNQNHTYDRQL